MWGKKISWCCHFLLLVNTEMLSISIALFERFIAKRIKWTTSDKKNESLVSENKLKLSDLAKNTR